MHEKVYVTSSMRDISKILDFRPFPEPDNPDSVLKRRYSDGFGELLDPTGPLPDKLFQFEGRRKKTLRKHFFTTEFSNVSEKAANALKSVDLGDGRLHPVQLYQKDRVTLIPGSFYIWHIAKQETHLDVENSQYLRGIGYQKSTLLSEEDETIALYDGALKGLDVWVDPRLRGHIFFSQRAYEAICKAGMRSFFHGNTVLTSVCKITGPRVDA